MFACAGARPGRESTALLMRYTSDSRAQLPHVGRVLAANGGSFRGSLCIVWLVDAIVWSASSIDSPSVCV